MARIFSLLEAPWAGPTPEFGCHGWGDSCPRGRSMQVVSECICTRGVQQNQRSGSPPASSLSGYYRESGKAYSQGQVQNPCPISRDRPLATGDRPTPEFGCHGWGGSGRGAGRRGWSGRAVRTVSRTDLLHQNHFSGSAFCSLAPISSTVGVVLVRSHADSVRFKPLPEFTERSPALVTGPPILLLALPQGFLRHVLVRWYS